MFSEINNAAVLKKYLKVKKDITLIVKIELERMIIKWDDY